MAEAFMKHPRYPAVTTAVTFQSLQSAFSPP